LGFEPDILLAAAIITFLPDLKKKIALFCNVVGILRQLMEDVEHQFTPCPRN